MAITMLAGYLVIINAAALLMMAEDKRRAKRHQWRVPEAALFGAALLGGSAGAWAGMYLFPPQNQALVFCGGYAADSGRTAGRWGVAGREQRPGLNNRERSAGAITVPQHRDPGRAFDFLG